MAEAYDGEILTAPPSSGPQPYTGEVLDAPPKRRAIDIGDFDKTIGVAQGAGSLLTGAAAAVPAGLSGIGAALVKALGITDMDPASVVRKVQEALTYQPTSETGKSVAGVVSAPFEALASGADKAGAAVTDATGSPLLGAATNTALQVVPQVIVGKGAGAVARVASKAKTAVANTVAPNIKTFEDAGAGTPSVGQATESSFLQGLENVAAKFPGGAGIMRRFAEKQQTRMGDTVATDITAEDAGRAIKRGVGQFADDFKAKSDALYNKLDQYIPPETRVDVRETRQALADLNADIPGAPALSKWFKNSKIQGIEEALKTDTEGTASTMSRVPAFGQAALEAVPNAERTAVLNSWNDSALPYEAVKKLRTLVGNELGSPSIVSDVPRSKWSALYAALSRDMEAVATEQGPEAAQAFSRATAYYKSGVRRIDDVLKPLADKVDPEEIFRAFMPKNADQANKVRGVMRSLDPAQREVVTDAVVNRLGRALPGKQSELGETFSSETFLTNWNKLSSGAKAQLFSDGTMRTQLDALARSSANIREGSKVFQNPSGTTGQAAAVSIYGSPVAALGTALAAGPAAGAAVLGGALGTVAAANVGARMLTSPKVVAWLSRASTLPPESMGAHLAQLGVIFSQTKDPQLKQELSQFINSVQPPTQPPQNDRLQYIKNLAGGP